MSFKDTDMHQINRMYDECIDYLKSLRHAQEVVALDEKQNINFDENDPENIENLNLEVMEKNCADVTKESQTESESKTVVIEAKTNFKLENELKTSDDRFKDKISGRLRRLSATLPKIIITQSNTSIDNKLNGDRIKTSTKRFYNHPTVSKFSDTKPMKRLVTTHRTNFQKYRAGYGDYPKRLVSKNGLENVALISNVPYERMRLLNDTFHTLINLRWRWIVSGTIVMHFMIWLVFAVFWYITALAHYDFEPDPPKKACVTGGKDFTTIFLASVEAQTTIGFGDRTIDEECPESIFLFVMQLIMGTGLSGVLTCVVYAKLTRPEKLSRDGVGFSKKAVISIRDGKLCLMLRAWDLNYDHIIGSEFCAHFVKTHRTKEGEVIRYFARSLELGPRQFLLWPVTLVHVIDSTSPLYDCTPDNAAEANYEITVSLKGASASMGTFTQSQTSYLPKEVMWGYRLPSVVKFDGRKQKYVIDHKKLDEIEPAETPLLSARQIDELSRDKSSSPPTPPGTPSSFSERMCSFHLERSSSFRKRAEKDRESGRSEMASFFLERSLSFRKRLEDKDRDNGKSERNCLALVPWNGHG